VEVQELFHKFLLIIAEQIYGGVLLQQVLEVLEVDQVL